MTALWTVAFIVLGWCAVSVLAAGLWAVFVGGARKNLRQEWGDE